MATRRNTAAAAPPQAAASSLPARRAVDALTPARESHLGYPEVLRLRRAAYREHIETHGLTDALAEFRAAMEAVHGPFARVWHNALPWDIAFLVGRYGEAIDYWPTEISEQDVARAAEWLKGGSTEWPNGVAAHPELREDLPVHGQDELGEVAPAPVADDTDAEVAP